MSDEENSPPVVFISYSHDTREHKQWVANLAAKLLENHIQVILDQWDLDLGDDVPKFMERALRTADRVLMLCTEPYVRKANDGKGGVGYEAMIVTGELVRDLGTKKFIPVIRQSSADPEVPDCVSTRLYVNFSIDGEFDESLKSLVEAIHSAKTLSKPALGPYPFQLLHSPSAAVWEKQVASETTFADAVSDPLAAYRLAVEIVAREDSATWRRLLRTLHNHAASELVAWRAKDQTVPSATKQEPGPLYDHALTGVGFYMPLFACLVAGAESGKPDFAAQLGWIDELLNPPGWERGGYTYWTDFPYLLLFVGNLLVGGALMESQCIQEAHALATARIADRYSQEERKPIFVQTGVTGWPEPLAHDCQVAWGFLNTLLDGTKWIEETFGSSAHAKASVGAYYQLMSFLNFCHLSVSGAIERGEMNWAVTVPLSFNRWPDDVTTRAYRNFIGNKKFLSQLLEANELSDPAKLSEHWTVWMKECRRWLGEVFRLYYHDRLVQDTLPDDLREQGLSLRTD